MKQLLIICPNKGNIFKVKLTVDLILACKERERINTVKKSSRIQMNFSNNNEVEN